MFVGAHPDEVKRRRLTSEIQPVAPLIRPGKVLLMDRFHEVAIHPLYHSISQENASSIELRLIPGEFPFSQKLPCATGPHSTRLAAPNAEKVADSRFDVIPNHGLCTHALSDSLVLPVRFGCTSAGICGFSL